MTPRQADRILLVASWSGGRSRPAGTRVSGKTPAPAIRAATPGSGRPGLSAEESGCSGCKPEDSGGLKFYCRKRGEVRKH